MHFSVFDPVRESQHDNARFPFISRRESLHHIVHIVAFLPFSVWLQVLKVFRCAHCVPVLLQAARSAEESENF